MIVVLFLSLIYIIFFSICIKTIITCRITNRWPFSITILLCILNLFLEKFFYIFWLHEHDYEIISKNWNLITVIIYFFCFRIEYLFRFKVILIRRQPLNSIRPLKSQRILNLNVIQLSLNHTQQTIIEKRHEFK